MTPQGPNPQTNLIFSIVAPVVALIAVAVIFFTKPVPVALTAPTPVNVAAAKLPDNGVVMASALPNAGSGPSVGGNASGQPGGPAAGGGAPTGPRGPSAAGVSAGGGPARGSNKGNGGALGAG